MKCKECGKRIGLRWMVFYWFHRKLKKRCFNCVSEKVHNDMDEFIFRGDASQID